MSFPLYTTEARREKVLLRLKSAPPTRLSPKIKFLCFQSLGEERERAFWRISGDISGVANGSGPRALIAFNYLWNATATITSYVVVGTMKKGVEFRRWKDRVHGG
jgi:hypothetical protein